MKLFTGLLTFAGCCALLHAQSPEHKTPTVTNQPVTLKDEPHHHLLFENPYTRVYHIEIPANSTSLLHKHEFPYISISQSSNEYTSVVAGQPDLHKKKMEGDEGYSDGGVVHFIRTDAGIPFHMLDVDLLQPQGKARNLCDEIVSQQPGPCDTSHTNPNEGMVIIPSFETDAVRVDRLELQRGETFDEIHNAPSLLVATGGATVAVSRVPGVMTQFLKPGDILWLPLGAQPKFNVEDGIEARLLLITFKNMLPRNP